MEYFTRGAPVEKKTDKRLDTPVNITVTSYRKRKHDPDGVSCKAVLDGIVRAGLLQDDSCKEVNSITFKSVLSQEEKTVIDITAIELMRGNHEKG